jgi:hypothetical protein
MRHASVGVGSLLGPGQGGPKNNRLRRRAAKSRSLTAIRKKRGWVRDDSGEG